MVNKQNIKWYVYMLECKNGMIYTGITTDLEKRFLRHKSGRGAKFTKRNPPSHILASKLCVSRSEACKLEWAIKQLSVTKKRLLVLQWGEITQN